MLKSGNNWETFWKAFDLYRSVRRGGCRKIGEKSGQESIRGTSVRARQARDISLAAYTMNVWSTHVDPKSCHQLTG